MDARARFLDWLANPNDLTGFSSHCVSRLPRPLESQTDRAGFQAQWTHPLQAAFKQPQIEPLLVGRSIHLDREWIACMGQIQSDQVASFLGIPAGPDRVLPIGIFVRIGREGFDQIRILFDLAYLAKQAGLQWWPAFAGRSLPHPRPPTLARPVDADTQRSRWLVESLIGGLNQLNNGDLKSMPQQDFWATDMGWYGPEGVGGAEGFDEYQTFAQGPSVASFPDRKGTWPKDAFVVEGRFAAFTSKPSLKGTFNGQAFRGLQPTGGPIEQTIMDFYVTRDGRLWRNWVFIDLIDFAEQCGVDIRQPQWWLA